MKYLKSFAAVAISVFASDTTSSCPSSSFALAWSSPMRSHNLRSPPRSSLSKTYSSTYRERKSNPLYAELSSAYDKVLPAALVGEAVRAALRSDRGICFDFTADRFNDNGGESRLVSVVQVRGKGTRAFLNAKFSQSVPIQSIEGSGAVDSETSLKLELVRSGRAYETGYLTSKGRIIDRILVLSFLNDKANDDNDEAFLVTSPGNSGSTLYDELAPFVFPMDQVALTDCSSASEKLPAQTSVITLACSKLNDVQTSFKNNVLELLDDHSRSSKFKFPTKSVCNHYRTKDTDVYILEYTFLPIEACHGYTLLIRGDGSLANNVWDKLTHERNDKGPVGVGSLEYETLRIEAGLPGYGQEMSGDGPKRKKMPVDTDKEINEEIKEEEEEKYCSKANPLELHLQYLVDTDKGCYQGQEGVASMMKNQRGCPRTLYQVVFYDSENDFDDDGGNDSFLMSIDTNKLREFQELKKQSTMSNDTRQPRPGDVLFVLGSNESIKVGTITSVAEPNGTGEAITVALALVRRPGSILDAIKDNDLDLPRWWENVDNDDSVGDGSAGNYGAKISRDKGTSGIMNPPPLDPLHNLEVTVGGTYTMGRLRSVPSRRYEYTNKGDVASLLDYERRGQVVKTFADSGVREPEIKVVSDKVGRDQNNIIDVTIDEQDDEIDNALAEAEKEAAEAAAQAEKAAAEAKRKAEKMEMLKARAEAAMAARRKKKE
ncbi:hypothetical protein HJC23_007124 [Cyclotella cryptica]|uniref:Uncharacterized protein n=1 Tax=Cyclotella cryptica TaxID=29204 RepID=A0ABD3NPG6_9STRA|eukprot:CCRYP_020349-RA/>CCRYP_020349-RA protein AED:0.01 eAED:0.01 QI:58/1/1/1/1/1/2/2682/715